MNCLTIRTRLAPSDNRIAISCCRAAQEQARHVAARNQHDQQRRRTCHAEHGGLLSTQQTPIEIRESPHPRGAGASLPRILAVERRSDGGDLGARLRDLDTIPEPSDCPQAPPHRAALQQIAAWVEQRMTPDGHPDVRRGRGAPRRLRAAETRRHDADDREGLEIQIDGATQHVGGAAVLTRPVAVAQHCNRSSERRQILRRTECASERRGRLQHLEVIP
jgi:hypothetical protein